MLTTDNLKEAERLMTVCNSCRYCEGLCAVFPAMEFRRAYSEGDLNYLANLCHNCGACYVDCQFSPPHEFDVNVPKTLARVRADSWKTFAWPAGLQPLFDRNGTAIAILACLSIAGFFLGFAALQDPRSLWSADGHFYRLIPHNALASLFGIIFGYAAFAMGMSFRNFWKRTGNVHLGPDSRPSIMTALMNIATLRYLDGGGGGCVNEDEMPNDRRRLFHHFTFYGFLLCFAATSAATLYHYLLHIPAPYSFTQLPKILGTLGGISLVVGTAGLFYYKQTRDKVMVDETQFGMDVAFIGMLFLTAASGLALMLSRQTPLLPVTLSIHLGAVFALFLSMPYGRFVHGLYRAGALLRFALEMRSGKALGETTGQTLS